jgi:anti-sigma-K factor RskA
MSNEAAERLRSVETVERLAGAYVTRVLREDERRATVKRIRAALIRRIPNAAARYENILAILDAEAAR